MTLRSYIRVRVIVRVRVMVRVRVWVMVRDRVMVSLTQTLTLTKLCSKKIGTFCSMTKWGHCLKNGSIFCNFSCCKYGERLIDFHSESIKY